MRTRYKIGELTEPIHALPGDTLNLTLTERESNGEVCYKHRFDEEITIEMTITHWIMFHVPGVGFGGMFGGDNLGSQVYDIFLDAELVDQDEPLFEVPE